MDYIKDVSAGAFPPDSRIFDYDWSPVEQVVIDYFTISSNVTTIYENLNVAQSTKDPKFEMLSSLVSQAFVSDNLIDYSS